MGPLMKVQIPLKIAFELWYICDVVGVSGAKSEELCAPAKAFGFLD